MSFAIFWIAVVAINFRFWLSLIVARIVSFMTSNKRIVPSMNVLGDNH